MISKQVDKCAIIVLKYYTVNYSVSQKKKKKNIYIRKMSSLLNETYIIIILHIFSFFLFLLDAKNRWCVHGWLIRNNTETHACQNQFAWNDYVHGYDYYWLSHFVCHPQDNESNFPDLSSVSYPPPLLFLQYHTTVADPRGAQQVCLPPPLKFDNFFF